MIIRVIFEFTCIECHKIETAEYEMSWPMQLVPYPPLPPGWTLPGTCDTCPVQKYDH